MPSSVFMYPRQHLECPWMDDLGKGRGDKWLVGNVSLLVEHLPSMPKTLGLSKLWPIISWFLWIFFFFLCLKEREKKKKTHVGLKTSLSCPCLHGQADAQLTLGHQHSHCYTLPNSGEFVSCAVLRWLAYGALQSHKCGVACANVHVTFKSLIFHSTVAMVTGIQSTDSPLIPLEDRRGLIFVLYGRVSLNDRDRLWKMCY